MDEKLQSRAQQLAKEIASSVTTISMAAQRALETLNMTDQGRVMTQPIIRSDNGNHARKLHLRASVITADVGNCALVTC